VSRNVDRRSSVAALNDAVQASNRTSGTAPEFGQFVRAPVTSILQLGKYYVVGQEGSAGYYRLPRIKSGDIGKTVSMRSLGTASSRVFVSPDMRVGDDSSTYYDVEPNGRVVIFIADSQLRYGLIGHGSSTNVQAFAATGTWAKPSWATWATVELWGGGGGGGGGRRSSAGIVAYGGSGGGGGGSTTTQLLCSDLSATEAVTIGAAGTGGTGRSGVNDGGNGTNGGATDFGTICYGFGGLRGRGGTAAWGLSAGGGGRPATRVANPAGERAAYGTNSIATGAEFGGGAGGWSSQTTANGVGGVSIKGGPGGGAGGHLAAGGATQAGSAGGSHNNNVETGGGGAGGAADTAGTAGGEATYVAAGNGGGGGGGQSTDGQNAGAGGAGGTAAGGGGGGGAHGSGASGAGAAGGAGYARITCW